MSEWRVLLDGPRPATAQMACDERLISLGMPMVRFFTWHPPALSFGFKQSPPEWLRLSPWSAKSLELVERPTGGGMAFHGSDVSLSVVVPRASTVPLEFIMRAVCQSAVRVCHAFGAEATALVEVQTEGRITYCLTEQSPYTVLIGARKVAGFAVRRYPDGWLIQGSLLVRRLPASLARALPEHLLQRIERDAIPLDEVLVSDTSRRETNLRSVRHRSVISERAVARHWSQRWSEWWEKASQVEEAVGVA